MRELLELETEKRYIALINLFSHASLSINLSI